MGQSRTPLKLIVFFTGAFLWSGQSAAWAQKNRAPEQLGPKSTIVEGHPALEWDLGIGNGLFILYTDWHNKQAFRFSVEHNWNDNIHHSCAGFLWVTHDEIAYMPSPSANQKCNVEQHGSVQAFDVDRSQITSLDLGQGNGFALQIGAKRFQVTYFVHDDAPNQWVPANIDPAPVSGKVAGYWLKLAFDDFPAAEREFLKTTRSAIPLNNSETLALVSAIQRAEAAEKAGDLRVAFDTYVSASANLPPAASGKDVDSLREHILELAPKLSPQAVIPDEAQRYFFGSQAALQEWKDKGNATKLDDAIEQLNEALRIAPWWPQAYFNRGLLLEQRGRYAEAIESLKLYLLASPNASDATQVQQKIYMLEYKARQTEAQK